MREPFLLDTNIVLVSLEAPERLTPKTRKLLEQEDLHISVLAYWEVLLKTMKGKLALRSARDWWTRALGFLQASAVPLYPDHISRIGLLPAVHKDPFDRALVAQATSEGMTLLTADRILLRYATDR